MTDKRWKRKEREFCALFGTTRKPVSGRQRDKDGDDGEHPRIHIQHKDGKQNAKLYRLWIGTRDKAHQNRKIPIIGLSMPGYRDRLVICRIEDLKAVAQEVVD